MANEARRGQPHLDRQEKRLWIVDHAVAYVDNGHVRLQIEKPTRSLPRKLAERVADQVWFAHQMRELEVARRRGETKTIPLTDRARRSSIRLGGGFMITQGRKILVAQRTADASRRPGLFCECGGIFEENKTHHAEDAHNDYISSLLKESQEIVLVRGETIYVPQLPPAATTHVAFEPPSTTDYNEIVEAELLAEASASGVPFTRGKVQRFWARILDYEEAVQLEFGYSPSISVEITAEIDTSSLECVGVLAFPEDIDRAVEAYKLDRWRQAADDARRKGQPEPKRPKPEKPASSQVEYWDTEMVGDPPVAVNRDIHVIDTVSGDVIVWSKVPGRNKRQARQSTLWNELSSVQLGLGEGRYATEKLQRAIRMHCPHPHLQPLVML